MQNASDGITHPVHIRNRRKVIGPAPKVFLSPHPTRINGLLGFCDISWNFVEFRGLQRPDFIVIKADNQNKCP